MQAKYLRNATKGEWNVQRCQPIFACSFHFPHPLSSARLTQGVCNLSCVRLHSYRMQNVLLPASPRLAQARGDFRHLLIKVSDFLHVYICVLYKYTYIPFHLRLGMAAIKLPHNAILWKFIIRPVCPSQISASAIFMCSFIIFNQQSVRVCPSVCV